MTRTRHARSRGQVVSASCQGKLDPASSPRGCISAWQPCRERNLHCSRPILRRLALAVDSQRLGVATTLHPVHGVLLRHCIGILACAGSRLGCTPHRACETAVLYPAKCRGTGPRRIERGEGTLRAPYLPRALVVCCLQLVHARCSLVSGTQMCALAAASGPQFATNR